jgi:hypothetical protein
MDEQWTVPKLAGRNVDRLARKEPPDPGNTGPRGRKPVQTALVDEPLLRLRELGRDQSQQFGATREPAVAIENAQKPTCVEAKRGSADEHPATRPAVRVIFARRHGATHNESMLALADRKVAGVAEDATGAEISRSPGGIREHGLGADYELAAM